MRLRATLEYIVKVTAEIDRDVAKGFDLTQFGDYMKFAHALQIQAQALLDIVQRTDALLGESPHSYIEAGEILVRRGLLSEEDYLRYRAVVGFKNIPVHYLSVNLRIMENILRNGHYREIPELAKKIVERIADP